MRWRPLLTLGALLSLGLGSSLGSPALAQPKPAPGGAKVPKLTKPPKLIKFVEAPYPPAEQQSGRAAAVVLRLALSETGTVTQVAVVESAGPAFDAAASTAAQGFLFEPAEVDDKPAAIKILYRYEFVLKAAVPTTGVFDGVVRTRKGKKPLAGVTVEIEGGGKAVTDAAGKFHLENVAPGKHAVTLEPGASSTFTAQRTEESIEAGKKLEATYEVEEQEQKAPGEGDDLEIVITAPPLRKQVVSTEVDAAQGRRVAGTQGDVLKVVENLPGVARATVGSGALVVWGAAPQDTRVYIDGVRVPRLYHDGGLRSVVHSDLVQSVELSPGGYGAPYGRGLGGLVTVQLRPMDPDGFHGSVAADAFDAAAAVRAQIGDKFTFSISARKSYLDALLPVFTSRDTSALFPIPRYADGAVRLGYQIDKRSSVEVGGLLSSDSTDRSTASADPSQRKTETTSLNWTRVYARYRHETDAGGAVTVTPWFGTESSSLVSRFGATPAELTDDTLDFGLRTSYRYKPAPFVTVTAGFDTEATRSKLNRSGSVTTPAREGDIRVFGQAPSDQTNADAWEVIEWSAAPFVEADFSLVDDRLHLIPGFRFDPYLLAVNRRQPPLGDNPDTGAFTSEPQLEPRLAITADASPMVRFKAAYGRYHQTPAPEDLSSVFGNPLLKSARADHFLAGALFRLAETVSVEATGFYETSKGLAARSALASPLLAQALTGQGAGRSYGAQFLLRKDLSHDLFGWVSYSLIRSERQDRTNGPWRLFDFDQTHVLTALASYAIGKGFEVGARFRYASGFPRTPVTGAYYDAKSDTYQPTFGAQNSIRIPPFVSLDLRASKRFTFGPTTELEIYLDVQNVTNRENPEELVYSRDYSEQRSITGLPILPSLGARFAW